MCEDIDINSIREWNGCAPARRANMYRRKADGTWTNALIPTGMYSCLNNDCSDMGKHKLLVKTDIVQDGICMVSFLCPHCGEVSTYEYSAGEICRIANITYVTEASLIDVGWNWTYLSRHTLPP